MKNKPIILIVAIIVIAILGYIFFRKQKQIIPNDSPTQASWFIPNETGWVEHTLDWKTYSVENVSFNYPPSYIVKIEEVERQAGLFVDQIMVLDPNSKSDKDDTIYFGIPYTGANDPRTIYMVEENVNNTDADFAISLQSSNYAQYIFKNIVASVSSEQNSN